MKKPAEISDWFEMGICNPLNNKARRSNSAGFLLDVVRILLDRCQPYHKHAVGGNA